MVGMAGGQPPQRHLNQTVVDGGVSREVGPHCAVSAMASDCQPVHVQVSWREVNVRLAF